MLNVLVLLCMEKDNAVQFLSWPTGGAGRVSSEAGRGEEQQAENQLSPGGGASILNYSGCIINNNMSETKICGHMFLPAAGIGE